MTWDIAIGEQLPRAELHRRFHGSAGRGISAPGRSYMPGNIMLFWRPERGHLFGYEDGWSDDGAFYFTGMGQYGDQEFGGDCPENGRVRDHQANRENVRLFEYATGNEWRYVAELELDRKAPWVWADGLDRLDENRRVIQFRFVKVGTTDTSGSPAVSSTGKQVAVPSIPGSPSTSEIESLGKASFERLLKARRIAIRRVELELVHEFADWLLTTHSLNSTGLTIPYAPRARPLRADLYVPAQDLLIEAKANTSREALRSALGQLLDYSRFVTPRPDLAVLVPHEPATDMKELLADLGVASIWRDEHGGFAGLRLASSD